MKKSENNIFEQLTDSLKTIVTENSEVEQCLAVQALGNLPSKKSLEILIEQLHNPDEDVRCDAGEALALIKDKAAIKPLIDNLIQDPIGEAKVIYIQALQAQKAFDSAEILCALVNTRGEKHNVAWEDYVSGWDYWADVQIAAIKALGSFGTDIDTQAPIAAILAAIDEPEGQNIWALATKTLVKFGDNGISALLELMKSASSLNRKAIISALGDAKDKQGLSLLEAAMSDPEPSVRMAAIISGAKRDLKEISLLGLSDGSAGVRAQVFKSYKFFDDKTIIAGLGDDNIKVQIAACEAIIRGNKTRPSLKLEQRAEKLLRKGSKQLLSKMIDAMAVAKPKGSAELIEDIVNHSASEKQVRLAALRALGELNSSKAVALLSNACADENQEIRLSAIGSLGKIAKTNGEAATKALEVLASAIDGELVATPKDWQPEEDNVIDFSEKKSLKKEERDQDSRMVKLDREGNIISPAKQVDIDKAIAEEASEAEMEAKIVELEEKPAPLSTLDAILTVNAQVQPADENIEIDERDVAFLEMAGKGPNKQKRLSPENKTPAHLDVRRLAALVGCETGSEILLEPLVKALSENDRQLSEAAIDGLIVLAQNDIDISSAQRNLLRLATTGEASISYRAVRALAYIKASVVTKVIAKLTNDENDTLRSEAIKASRGREIEIDLADLCVNAPRQSRMAAAELIATKSAEEAVPSLFGFAFVEDGVHKQIAAELLKSHQGNALNVTLDLLKSEQARERLIGLDILKSILRA